MLKYGTQLPAPSQARNTAAKQGAMSLAAAFIIFCCFVPVIIVIGLIIASVFAAFVGGVMSNLHHP